MRGNQPGDAAVWLLRETGRFLLSAVAAALLFVPSFASPATECVDPFIGTSASGHCSPAACVPFGLVQAGPDTGNGSWDYCGGYRYEDKTIDGFSQTHLFGTGRAEMGDVLLLPYCGGTPRRTAALDHAREKARPGFYSLELPDAGVNVKIAAARRAAIYALDYLRPDARLLLDLQHGLTGRKKFMATHVLSNRVEFAADGLSLRGTTFTKRDWGEHAYSYHVAFSRPFKVLAELPRAPGERAGRYVLGFDGAPGTLLVKTALSVTSPEAARANLAAEIPDWDFDRVAKAAGARWDELLSRTEVVGTPEERTRWYSALYRLCVQPNDISDAADGRPNYSTLSLWDTYRAAHPFYTLVAPELVKGVVDSMLRHAREKGALPIWSIWGFEGHCMIGNHAVPVIADAWRKGVPFDRREAWRAVKASLTRELPGYAKNRWSLYDRHGYFPCDVVKFESASMTLECAFDDWCAAELAHDLGETADEAFFRRRAGFWRNVLDPATGFVRGRDSHGAWRTPFDPGQYGWGDGFDFTEGCSWQWTWHVLHDPGGLVAALGGKAAFAAKLDELFTRKPNVPAWMSDVTGLVGEYAHGNEPCHHVAYLYRYADRPDRTAERVREICDRFYRNAPDGVCGNEDCGQMSAWFLFSALGFYPLNPASGTYVIGAPQLPAVTLRLPGGAALRMRANDLSRENKYVKSVTWNGRPVKGFLLRHEDLAHGGELVFEMAGKEIFDSSIDRLIGEFGD